MKPTMRSRSSDGVRGRDVLGGLIAGSVLGPTSILFAPALATWLDGWLWLAPLFLAWAARHLERASAGTARLLLWIALAWVAAASTHQLAYAVSLAIWPYA